MTNHIRASCHVTNYQLIRWTYAASKGAINILTKNMALDLAQYKIRVNSVSPAWIWSPEVNKVRFQTKLGWEDKLSSIKNCHSIYVFFFILVSL